MVPIRGSDLPGGLQQARGSNRVKRFWDSAHDVIAANKFAGDLATGRYGFGLDDEGPQRVRDRPQRAPKGKACPWSSRPLLARNPVFHGGFRLTVGADLPPVVGKEHVSCDALAFLHCTGRGEGIQPQLIGSTKQRVPP